MSTVLPAPVAPMKHLVDDRMDFFAKKTQERKTPKSGMFGWLFPDLAAFRADTQDLVELGTAMVATSGQKDLDSKIPAGFTFLGQFVAHDITFDTTPFPERVEDPQATQNFRTPALDLDCLYGNGPLAHPFLYRRASNSFVMGKNAPIGVPAAVARKNFPDVDVELPRNDDNVAIIADPRNDENLVVSQLHVAMLSFHNQVVRKHPGWEFERVRKHVTLHYQWILLHDFLGRLVDEEVLHHVVTHGPKFYKPKKFAFTPVEFSAAAYRFGHGTVRDTYSYNANFPIAQLPQLFQFTSALGGAPAPANWVIDWHRFFFRTSGSANSGQNFARKIGPMISPTMGDLPKGLVPAIGLPLVKGPDNRNLAVRNLLRGNGFGLPSGQSVAKQMKKVGLPVQVLRPEDISTGPDGKMAAKHGFDKKTPLWYYILKEAHVMANGDRLGPVGSRILAEVFIGLLRCPGALLHKENEDFSPTLGREGRQFTMLDLLDFAGQLNRRG